MSSNSFFQMRCWISNPFHPGKHFKSTQWLTLYTQCVDLDLVHINLLREQCEGVLTLQARHLVLLVRPERSALRPRKPKISNSSEAESLSAKAYEEEFLDVSNKSECGRLQHFNQRHEPNGFAEDGMSPCQKHAVISKGELIKWRWSRRWHLTSHRHTFPAVSGIFSTLFRHNYQGRGRPWGGRSLSLSLLLIPFPKKASFSLSLWVSLSHLQRE